MLLPPTLRHNFPLAFIFFILWEQMERGYLCGLGAKATPDSAQGLHLAVVGTTQGTKI